MSPGNAVGRVLPSRLTCTQPGTGLLSIPALRLLRTLPSLWPALPRCLLLAAEPGQGQDGRMGPSCSSVPVGWSEGHSLQDGLVTACHALPRHGLCVLVLGGS